MSGKDSKPKRNGGSGKPSIEKKSDGGTPRHEASTTDRPETPELEGIVLLPEELTGRASRTDESLTSLFDNRSAGHLKDGFHGGSGDDEPTLDQTDGPGDAEEEDDGA